MSHLIERLHRFSTLRNAWSGLDKNPRSHGLSPQTIEQFSLNLRANLKSLQREIKTGTFRFSAVKASIKRERRPSGEIKPRPLRSAEVRDRVVQRAIANIIRPSLTKKYHLKNKASFAYLPRMGVKDALRRMVELYKLRRPVVLEADLENFFGTVDQRKLLDEMVFRALPDPSLNQLIREALTQEIGNKNELSEEDLKLFPEGDLGIPQGGGLSPLFANVY